jgi:putative MATE family efflux protein
LNNYIEGYMDYNFIQREIDMGKDNEKKMPSSLKMDMCNGPMAGKMLRFALPLMLSSLLQCLFNASDTIVVGKFASMEALAAVGSTGSLINLIINLFVGLSVGVNVVAAQYYGAGRENRINRMVHTSITLALVCGVVLMVAGVLAARPMLQLMSSPKDVIDLAALYVRIYFIGIPALMVYNFGAAMLRASGDTKRPMYYLLAAGVINVILNLIFVIGFKMSVEGVAIPTAISLYVSAGLIMRGLIKEKGALHFDYHKLGLDKVMVKSIVRIGLPAGFQGTVFSMSNVVIQSAINSFGSIVVAGSAAAANIEGFVYVAMNAFYQTAITFVGQNYGARKYHRVNRAIGLCQAMVIVAGITFGGFAMLFSRQLLGIYSPDSSVIAAGVKRMRLVCAPYFLCGIMDVMVGGL